MRHVTSRYIYGLSATPKREDGLFKVITMYCGPIRKQVRRDTLQASYTFRQYLVPRYTNHRILQEKYSYTDMCTELMKDAARNFMIVKDVLTEYRNRSNIIILTERIEHLAILFGMLEKACDDVYMLSGSVSKKERKITLSEVRSSHKQYILLATSKLLGEGFDLPSLNCLFLVLPISSKTRITQYTGRIHRTYDGKDTVKVYDYVDAQIPMAQSMYYKRLKQYEKEGYYTITENREEKVDRILYEKHTYEKQLLTDIRQSKKEIVIFSASLTIPKVKKYASILRETAAQGVKVYVIVSSGRTHDKDAADYLAGAGVQIRYAMHNKHFVIIDRNCIWNCSFDIFSSVPAESFATRDENSMAAEEIIASIRETDDGVNNLFSV